ncbi:MAG TPA: AraD1 family protein [Acidobacteriota bacterium]|nr:AraD1 family protein [Acidobacteriota bacterium]
MRIIQIAFHTERRLGLVDGESIRLLRDHRSVHSLAIAALDSGIRTRELVERNLTSEQLEYTPIYQGLSEWRILPAADHPDEPARCLVSGTGLTHVKSARTRQAMHAAGEETTDSARMYQWGVEGGRPAPDAIGVAPEWFYKGPGSVLRAHLDPLWIPAYAEDGGEEPEIAGVYIISRSGEPFRIGMAAGNEFSDHGLEKRNYLYLASSKLRTCAIGPELVLDPDFTRVDGMVSIEREGRVLWSKPIHSGEEAMCHSLANLEHHHFKFESHRRPGDLHIHFFGADAFSFGEGIRLSEGDLMVVEFQGFGRPLRNPLRVATNPASLMAAKPL